MEVNSHQVQQGVIQEKEDALKHPYCSFLAYPFIAAMYSIISVPKLKQSPIRIVLSPLDKHFNPVVFSHNVDNKHSVPALAVMLLRVAHASIEK